MAVLGGVPCGVSNRPGHGGCDLCDCSEEQRAKTGKACGDQINARLNDTPDGKSCYHPSSICVDRLSVEEGCEADDGRDNTPIDL